MAVFPRRPVRRTRSGRYALSLSPDERAVVANLAPQLRDMLSSTDDPGLRRLFPPAFIATGDEERQTDYERLMHDDLVERHAGALEVLERTAMADELDAAEVEAWARALNQLRLVFGTRLDVSEDDEAGMGDDPEHHLYLFLGYLQECVVEALLSAIPEGGR